MTKKGKNINQVEQAPIVMDDVYCQMEMFSAESTCKIVGISFLENVQFSWKKPNNEGVLLEAKLPYTFLKQLTAWGGVFMTDISIMKGDTTFIVPKGYASYQYKEALISSDVCIDHIVLTISIRKLRLKAKPKKAYYRSVQPINKEERNWCNGLNSFIFCEQQKKRSHQLVQIKVDNIDVRVFESGDNIQSYLVIETLLPVDFDKFASIQYSILLTLGLIRNYLVYHESFLFKSNKKGMTTTCLYEYVKMIDSVKSQYPIITPYFIGFEDVIKRNKISYCSAQLKRLKDKVQTQWIEPELIGNVATILVKYPSLQRALNILINGTHANLEYQASVFFIALETICNVCEKIMPKQKDTLVGKEKWETICERINNVITDFSENIISKDKKEQLIKNIRNKCNSVPNGEKLSRPFDYFGYKLTMLDTETLNKDRNRYLHGNVSGDSLKEQETEIFRTCCNVHKLCCILLLLMAGYDGYIINNAVLFGFKQEKKTRQLLFTQLKPKRMIVTNS